MIASISLFVINLVLINFLDRHFKECLTFWRFKNPLPGTRAFTEIILNNPRVNSAAIKAKIGALPTDPNEQNILWYSIFQSMESENKISDQNKQFVLLRDLVGQIFTITILGLVYLLCFYTLMIALKFLLINLVIFIFISRSAQVRGKALVETVLAKFAIRP